MNIAVIIHNCHETEVGLLLANLSWTHQKMAVLSLAIMTIKQLVTSTCHYLFKHNKLAGFNICQI